MGPFSLQNKTVLVTGASSGIGRATAMLCAELGAKVILLGRDTFALEVTLQGMPGTEHVIVQYDLLDFNSIPKMIQNVVSSHGLLDGIAHCAGIHMAKPLRMLSVENIDDIVKMNVTTGILLAKAFRHKTISTRPAAIVFLSSVVANVGQAAVVPYALSKGALVAAVKSLAVELSAEEITVNAVLPGVIETPMSEKLFQKMGESQIETVKNAHLLGLGTPRDVACSIAFLLSSAARWITGSCLTVDGGYTAI